MADECDSQTHLGAVIGNCYEDVVTRSRHERSASYRVALGREIVGSGFDRTRVSWNTKEHRVQLNGAFQSRSAHCTVMDVNEA